MAFDKGYTINTIYPTAAAAYTAMAGPSVPLGLPPGYQSIGTIVVDEEVASVLINIAKQSNPHVVSFAQKIARECNIFGLVAWNSAEKTAIVAIRGSLSLTDWLADLGALLMPFDRSPSHKLVHMGFALVYQHIWKSISDLVKGNCAGATKIVVTGHSLGGALATLCTLDLSKNLTWKPEIVSCTFASPRVGSPEFKEVYDEAIPESYHIVNFMDVVPQVPLPPVFEHVGNEVKVTGGFHPLDITFAHHLTTYLIGLSKLP